MIIEFDYISKVISMSDNNMPPQQDNSSMSEVQTGPAVSSEPKKRSSEHITVSLISIYEAESSNDGVPRHEYQKMSLEELIKTVNNINPNFQTSISVTIVNRSKPYFSFLRSFEKRSKCVDCNKSLTSGYLTLKKGQRICKDCDRVRKESSDSEVKDKAEQPETETQTIIEQDGLEHEALKVDKKSEVDDI
jgi:hypothetical protein